MKRPIYYRYRLEEIPGFRVHTLDQIERGAIRGYTVLSRDEWSGVKDENGVGIYENDIVQNRYGGTAKVEQHSGGFWFCIDDGHESEMRVNPMAVHKAGWHVMGDIYQQRLIPPRRPELRVVK